MIARWWHYALPLAALAFQPVPILFIRLSANLSYPPPPTPPESSIWILSLLGLALCALASLALASVAAYFMLCRSRLLVAVPMIVVGCVPAWLAGAVYLLGTLCFLA